MFTRIRHNCAFLKVLGLALLVAFAPTVLAADIVIEPHGTTVGADIVIEPHGTTVGADIVIEPHGVASK